jgi:UDP:flavonoid glycosyltransferase YjiC (YdhE family)
MTALTAARKLNVLLPALGSAGDVHPFIGLGLALQARGHRVTIMASPVFQDLIEQFGLKFLAVGTIEGAERMIADPNLWHPRKGFSVVARGAMIPAIPEVYRLIEKHADADTVVAASSLCLGARIAQEKLGVPTATVHLQPGVIRSLIDQGMAGNIRISASQPMWFKRAFFRLADWALIDRELQRPLNTFRASLGLPPVARVMHRWIHSPQCVIAFFPGWFAKPQDDWPPNTHPVGFPLWDGGGGDTALSAEAETFLADGPPPVVFTPGSAGSTMHRFFGESVEALRQLKARAMLVTNFPEQVPSDLPANVRTFGYLPFSDLLPRAALLVHHGGIGTTAQATKAGIPQLVVPKAHDQFDNAWRIQNLGLGRTIVDARYRSGGVAATIREMLADEELKTRCRGCAPRVDSAATLAHACELIEGLTN